MLAEEETQGACFSGTTPILMENGTYEDIERVLVGTKVLSRCELTGEIAYKKVSKKFHHAHVTRPGDPYGYEIPAYLVMYSTTNPKWGGGERGGVLYAKAEQMVRLVNSYRAPVAAEGIEVGDVFFTDDNKRVMAVQVETANGISHIHWTSGWGGLHVSPEHPIWVEGKGWTPVRDIRSGDQLMTNDGSTAIVRKVETEHETYNLYGLDVEDFHAYFADSGIWVRCKAMP
jgi:hypothetical protein